MADNISIRDLLYFDFEKAASLLSQLEGGLLEKISESHETSEDERNVRTYELLKLFKGEFGGIAIEKPDFSDASFQRAFMHISAQYPMKVLHPQWVMNPLPAL